MHRHVNPSWNIFRRIKFLRTPSRKLDNRDYVTDVLAGVKGLAFTELRFDSFPCQSSSYLVIFLFSGDNAQRDQQRSDAPASSKRRDALHFGASGEESEPRPRVSIRTFIRCWVFRTYAQPGWETRRLARFSQLRMQLMSRCGERCKSRLAKGKQDWHLRCSQNGTFSVL